MSIIRKKQVPTWLMGHEWVGNGTGARVRKARVEKGMTKRDLASEIGVTEVTINNIENEHTKVSLPTLSKLAGVLGVPVYYLGCIETLPENTFGQQLKKARLYHGLTKREAGKQFGVDEKTIGNWEAERNKPSHIYNEKLDSFLTILKK